MAVALGIRRRHGANALCVRREGGEIQRQALPGHDRRAGLIPEDRAVPVGDLVSTGVLGDEFQKAVGAAPGGDEGLEGSAVGDHAVEGVAVGPGGLAVCAGQFQIGHAVHGDAAGVAGVYDAGKVEGGGDVRRTEGSVDLRHIFQFTAREIHHDQGVALPGVLSAAGQNAESVFHGERARRQGGADHALGHHGDGGRGLASRAGPEGGIAIGVGYQIAEAGVAFGGAHGIRGGEGYAVFRQHPIGLVKGEEDGDPVLLRSRFRAVSRHGKQQQRERQHRRNGDGDDAHSSFPFQRKHLRSKVNQQGNEFT